MTTPSHPPKLPHLSDEERLAIRDEQRRVAERGIARLADDEYDWDAKTKPGAEIVIHLHQPEKPTTKEEPESERPHKTAKSVAVVFGAFGGFLREIPPTGRVIVALALVALVGYVAQLLAVTR